jgi:hypothetical protein
MSQEWKWTIEEQAKTVAALLASEMDELPIQIMRLDEDTAAILMEIDRVDYVLTMTRVPQQRPRPTAS